ncbi:MAG: hypothetical protein QM805_07645 [Pseudomonas sp.]
MSEDAKASNVVSPWGYSFPERYVSDDLVKNLEELLEKAKAGEIIGAMIVSGYHDGLAGWRISGKVGNYSMLGAATLACRNLEHIANED